MKQKSGFAFHCHHDQLVEWVTDFHERVVHIKNIKPEHEIELRLKLFKFIPLDRLPIELNKAREAHDEAQEVHDEAQEAYDKAWEVYRKAREAYDKAGEAYRKAGEAYDKEWEAYAKAWKASVPQLVELHKELCPNCPWDGKTIFTDIP